MKKQWILSCILAAALGLQLNAERSALPTILPAEETGSQQTSTAPSPLKISGELELNTRYAINSDGFGSGEELESIPELRLDLDYRKDRTKIHVTGRVEQDPGEDQAEGKLEEAYLRYNARKLDLEIGYMKPIWGAGGTEHAVDILTPVDYSDFTNPEYSERKLSEVMFKLDIPAKEGLLEIVYLPVFTPDTLPWDGAWVSREIQTVQETMDSIGSLSLAEEQTADLSHSSFAFRFTRRRGIFDLGGIYYIGYYRQPTITIDSDAVTLNYDRVNMIGLHGTAVTGGTSLRGEAGWYVTEDYQGDDPDVRNSEFRWVAGFEYNPRASDFTIGIQEAGSMIMNSDAIESSQDVQADSSTTENELTISLRTILINPTMEPELSVSVNLEDLDYRIKPSLTTRFLDQLEFSLAASIFGGSSDGSYGYFDDKDFIELNVSFQF